MEISEQTLKGLVENVQSLIDDQALAAEGDKITASSIKRLTEIVTSLHARTEALEQQVADLRQQRGH